MVDRVDWTTPLEEERKWARMNNMERISYLLSKLMNHVEVVVRRTSHFVSGMKDIISGMNPQEYKNTLDDIEYLRMCITSIPTVISAAGLDIAEQAMHLYTELDRADLAMERVIGVINNPTYERLSRTSASQSIIVDSQLNRDAARRAHNTYTVERVQDDTIITGYITDVIMDAAERGDTTYIGVFEFIMKNASQVNKFTVKLISRIITLLPDEQRKQLELLVEKQKDDIIGSTRVNVAAKGITGNMVRYGLVPASNLMTMERILTWLDPDIGTDIATAAQHLNAKGIGIITINIANSSPVNYDLHGLIDAKYIAEHKLTAGRLAGLNKIVLAKYETAMSVRAEAGDASTNNDPHQRYGDVANCEYWHVLESIAPDAWRALGVPVITDKISVGEVPLVVARKAKPSQNKKSKSTGKTKRAEINPAVIIDKNPMHADINTKIPRDQIRGMLEGLSTRCAQYNSICAETIVARAVDEQLRVIADEYELHHKDTSMIGVTLTNALSDQFAKLNPDITSPDHFRSQALVRESTQNVMLKVFVHTTGTRGRGQDEYMISFIAKFDAIFDRFMRELEKQIDLIMPTRRIFAELGAKDLREELSGSYRAAVSATVRELEKIKLWDNYDTSLKQFTLDKRFIVV